ncbi:TauD/TfdA family dioxygenase [Streptomyces sp. NPDC006739]|uniref:TauD/TfdA family dioxygenase n=1 Tax=Streptomyces sp. NPDC006739 TaxID=3364763 RepID=UPI0036BBF6DE
MQPFHVIGDRERDELYGALEAVDTSPYADYRAFSTAVRRAADGRVPASLAEAAERIREERERGVSDTHVLRNCPVDKDLPELGHDDPQADKYARKRTFVGEGFLELMAQLTRTPLMSYATRFRGDFFTDVYSISRYHGQQTGYSDGELVYHNDRTAHPVRADYISLLGMRCPVQEYTCTSLVEARTLRAALPADTLRLLGERHFVTPFDVVSRDNNRDLGLSEKHAVFQGDYGIRYLDTHTTVAPDAPGAAKDALIELKNALTRAEKKRHRILEGDLLVFANQNGLHSRELIEVNDPERSRSRWLLKTYAFRDRATADGFADRWVDGVAGRVGD